VKNCLKKKNDEKEKANQACEDHEQMFVATLSANDHTTYDWIVNSSAIQHVTFKHKWFTTYECISPRSLFMGNDTILEAISKGNIKATMQVGGKLSHATITQVLHVLKIAE
jgi:hypothetical protein